MEYLVKREHIGDKLYVPGDTREAEPADVAHLVRLGVLEGGDDATKAAGAAPANKAEAPQKNKSARGSQE